MDLLDIALSRLSRSRPEAEGEARDWEKAPEMFHEGQMRAWHSSADLVAVVAGWQSGKTTIGAPWMMREITRSKACDFALVSPTFPLLEKKVLPEMLKACRGLGRLIRSKRVIEIDAKGAEKLGRSEPLRIWLGCADHPESLESATYGAVWFDEPGQAPEGSHHVLVSRVAVERGRLLYTSRPYHFNWYKRLIWDRRGEEGLDVVSFRSIDNPSFPRAVYEKAKESMPGWMHAMRYDGQFTRPGGAVYDCFDPAVHCQKKEVPKGAEMVVGLDFGTANMAGVVLARMPDGSHHVVGTYHKGGRTDSQHAASLMALAMGRVSRCAGGSWSEDEWRLRFMECGLDVERPPYREVSSRIQCVYRLLAEKRLTLDPGLTRLIKELEEYRYETDDDGEPLERIEDKAKFHRLDALGYILSAERPLLDLGVTAASYLGGDHV
jgi:phage terminase large subunit-like protein